MAPRKNGFRPGRSHRMAGALWDEDTQELQLGLRAIQDRHLVVRGRSHPPLAPDGIVANAVNPGGRWHGAA